MMDRRGFLQGAAGLACMPVLRRRYQRARRTPVQPGRVCACGMPYYGDGRDFHAAIGLHTVHTPARCWATGGWIDAGGGGVLPWMVVDAQRTGTTAWTGVYTFYPTDALEAVQRYVTIETPSADYFPDALAFWRGAAERLVPQDVRRNWPRYVEVGLSQRAILAADLDLHPPMLCALSAPLRAASCTPLGHDPQDGYTYWRFRGDFDGLFDQVLQSWRARLLERFGEVRMRATDAWGRLDSVAIRKD